MLKTSKKWFKQWVIAMAENIKPSLLKEKIDIVRKDLPNLNVPTMGIIPEEQKVDINNNEYLNIREVKED